MPNLLVVGRYSDKDFISCDYIFLSHLVNAQRHHFDQVFVVALTPYVPRLLRPFARFSDKIRFPLLKTDYTTDNVHVLFARYPFRASQYSQEDRVRALWPAVLDVVQSNDLKFDIIHSHMTPDGWFGVKLGKMYDVPTVLTIHDNHDWLMENLSLPTVRECVLNSDTRIRVAPGDIDDIRAALGRSAEELPIHYNPNGFDAPELPQESQQQLRKELDLPENRSILVSVARWRERKDPLILVDAIHAISAKNSGNCPLLCLIGEDKMGGKIQERISSLGVGHDVRLLGQKPPSEVLRYMKASTGVVLFSHSEGNPSGMDISCLKIVDFTEREAAAARRAARPHHHFGTGEHLVRARADLIEIVGSMIIEASRCDLGDSRSIVDGIWTRTISSELENDATRSYECRIRFVAQGIRQSTAYAHHAWKTNCWSWDGRADLLPHPGYLSRRCQINEARAHGG